MQLFYNDRFETFENILNIKLLLKEKSNNLTINIYIYIYIHNYKI